MMLQRPWDLPLSTPFARVFSDKFLLPTIIGWLFGAISVTSLVAQPCLTFI